MSRTVRQQKILDIIEKHNIDKQEVLVEYLLADGVKATQATISRDIKELGLVKVLSDDKKYKYVSHTTQSDRSDVKLYTLFKSSVLSFACSENILVVHTLPGGASSAAAVIDNLKMPEVLGVVAGDDTIIVVTVSKTATPSVKMRLEDLLA